MAYPSISQVRRFLVVSLALIGFQTSMVSAQVVVTHSFLDAEQLMSMCVAGDSYHSVRLQLSEIYVMGLIDAEAQRSIHDQQPLFCLPDGTTQHSINDSVCTFAVTHPNLSRLSAASVAFAALIQLYPCGPSSSR